MKTIYSSKLFVKKIDLGENSSVFGAQTGGCVVTEICGGGEDTLTSSYDDNGRLISQKAVLTRCDG